MYVKSLFLIFIITLSYNASVRGKSVACLINKSFFNFLSKRFVTSTLLFLYYANLHKGEYLPFDYSSKQ